MELTVISPHPDDAAFSLGGTLDALARRGVAITLVSCHSRSVGAHTLRLWQLTSVMATPRRASASSVPPSENAASSGCGEMTVSSMNRARTQRKDERSAREISSLSSE